MPLPRDVDPRQPVMVGVGELKGAGEEGPPAMMAEAVRRAAADSAASGRLLRRLGAVAAVPSIGWPDGAPATAVARELGIEPGTLRSSLQGGNGPQLLVGELAARIRDGALDAGVVCGAEALATVVEHQKRGSDPGWPEADPERGGDEVLEAERHGHSDVEAAAGANAPIVLYPLIENAIRRASGDSVEAHQRRIASLWAAFSRVAAGHPCAWSPHEHNAEYLARPSGGNRSVSFPYPKLLNADIQVDQAAAAIVCSAQAASDLGVPVDRWVFVHASASADDEWFVSERRELHRSPALEACGRAVYDHAGTGPDELRHVDLYSCFPAAVELAAVELGLPLEDPARPPTCTGGLTFFGGAGNNYATHGIAAVARRLRDGEPGELGLSTALGWYATKHALGLYGNRAPRRGYARLEPAVERPEPRRVADPGEHEGEAETCTVIYERDGSPGYGIVFALLDDGRRALGMARETELMRAMTGDDFLGSTVRIGADGAVAA